MKITDLTLLTGRALLAAIFLISGFGKLADPTGTIAYITSVGAPFPELGYAIALLVEIPLAAALLLGYRTQITATLIALFTLATAFMFHFDFSNQLQTIMFLKNLAITGGLLQVAVFGAGRLSIDTCRR
ncbi:putative oxidoreductase [Methylobacillus rhizosphaerae]|uniref:Putative oxidoreductase n=1 Tax=Methylobacillus rhizosphaerae TaxID=551994 RepID=A0A238Z967_9PROT|nr:DoxX family protein [Methylobacillus rhizosphaerae]SNR79244.1 putative oxidoreductase [Methylobacillus rhizosphaerae]